MQGEDNGGSMTYEEFKKELRWNVQNMETARGKTIRLLERHMVCGDPMAVHIMNIMNRCMYGREQIMIREDMLCALWMRGKREYIQHWLIRTGRMAEYFTGDLGGPDGGR